MKTIKETCLLFIRMGDMLMIKSDGRTGQLIDIQLVPNGVNDTTLVALLTIKLKTGKFQATSDNFMPVAGEYYLEKMYN